MGTGDLTGSAADEPISVRARFERFPATVKGAFILRGEDPDPHQVAWREARVVGVGVALSRPMPMVAATLDVAPHRDVFVPFELGVSDLEPGWYTLECDLVVDGSDRTYDGGRRFSVPWPRATVRRGQVRVDRRLDLAGRSTIVVEQADLGGDSARVHLSLDPMVPFTAKLSADGDSVPVLEIETDEEASRATIVSYPVRRSATVLRIELKAKGRGATDALEIRLP